MVERRMRYNRNDCTSCNSQNGGCNSQNGGMNSNTSSLLKRLRKVDFAIVDTMLYLDAYPHCKAALEYYKKLVTERHELAKKLVAESRELRAELADAGMPMRATDNSSDSWRWIDSPWPWEYEANV